MAGNATRRQESCRAFFESLSRCADKKVPQRMRGTVRIDLFEDGEVAERYFATMRDGGMTVDLGEKPAEAIITSSLPVFRRLMSGDSSALAATLRNEMTWSGDIRLVRVFCRFFPASNVSRDPRERARAQHPHGREWRRRLDENLVDS